ncbi:hypothetical protein AXG93_3012s1030 [Marchantia polymorpha subsp. ruderalis]|uniref:Uncharacterized protein n=1 Tax=Marchantia polymorpha subsp. ruderalis TaxID=1480154 RepID=A0A176VCI8_MARPO|nr:hypothetical protein AXG93_3012s1030 [Marchantia polymorpha subsp. ruderalis]
MEAYDIWIQTVTLKQGNLALMYDNRQAQFSWKLHLRWMGPYRVVEWRTWFDEGKVLPSDFDDSIFGVTAEEPLGQHQQCAEANGGTMERNGIVSQGICKEIEARREADGNSGGKEQIAFC